MRRRLRLPASALPRRLDLFLCGLEEIPSRTVAQGLIKRGGVFLNGQPETSPKREIAGGDEIGFEPVPFAESGLEPVHLPLEIRFEDEHLLVVRKEAGLVTHPSAKQARDSLVHRLLARTSLEATDPEGLRPGIVHRLDKETSGLMVVAKTADCAERLSLAFAGRKVEKLYQALLTGNPKGVLGIVDRPIGRSSGDRKKRAVRHDGKEAKTRWRKVAEWKGFALVECRPETGRTHQIRVHMAYAGHPVAGDEIYGRRESSFADASRRLAFQKMGMALHACGLGFDHPFTGKPLAFREPMPERMRRFVSTLGKTSGGSLPSPSF